MSVWFISVISVYRRKKNISTVKDPVLRASITFQFHPYDNDFHKTNDGKRSETILHTASSFLAMEEMAERLFRRNEDLSLLSAEKQRGILFTFQWHPTATMIPAMMPPRGC
jgi:hypothetical protein